MTYDYTDSLPNTSDVVPKYCWLPVDALLPGMTLARRIVGRDNGRVTMMLAEGSLLTAGMIAQLMTKAVECVAVLNEHPPKVEDYLIFKQAYEARLRMIFDRADGLTDDCRALFDALVLAGPIL